MVHLASPLVEPTTTLPPRAFIFTASPREDSLSAHWASKVAEHLETAGISVFQVSQRALPLVPAGLESFEYPDAIHDVLAIAGEADIVVLAAPVQRAAVAGVARNAVELLRSAIEGKPLLPVIAAGSQRSHLAAEAFRADLFVNFG